MRWFIEKFLPFCIPRVRGGCVVGPVLVDWAAIMAAAVILKKIMVCIAIAKSLYNIES